MAVKKMYKCNCQSEVMLNLFPERRKYPYLCPWCNGTGEWEGIAYLNKYKGDFKLLDYDEIYDTHDDVYVSFRCVVCDDYISFNESGETMACKCGKIYRLNVTVKVEKSYIGDINFILKESEK